MRRLRHRRFQPPNRRRLVPEQPHSIARILRERLDEIVAVIPEGDQHGRTDVALQIERGHIGVGKVIVLNGIGKVRCIAYIDQKSLDTVSAACRIERHENASAVLMVTGLLTRQMRYRPQSEMLIA